MLNNLFKLYNRNRSRTPLEDFTTEAFVGILNYEPKIKNDFIKDFLKLPDQHYRIKTQVKFNLTNDTDCIIDIVIESENTLCFIENKVDSTEGVRQLERYAKVLNIYKDKNYKTQLFYLTKKAEEKNVLEHDFRQLRWFQIAEFLKQYRNNAIVIDFLNFLKIKNMSQDLTISTKDLFVIENLVETMEIIKGYLDRIEPIFIQTFKSNAKLSYGCSTKQLIQFERLIYYHKDIVGQSGWSEIKYGFQTSNAKIYVGIWVDKTNTNFSSFEQYFRDDKHGFEVYLLERGIAIELKKPLKHFINQENADKLIIEWFTSTFSTFVDLIKNIDVVSWKINVN